MKCSYMVFNIERAGRKFQAGNKNIILLNVKDVYIKGSNFNFIRWIYSV